jgi:hypothetical protein
MQGVSAFTVSSISIDPSGSLTPGTAVTAAFKIDGAGTGEDSNDLQLYTDLTSPKWTYTIIVNDIENIRPVVGSKTLTITGFELAYKSDDVVDVRVTLEGNAPTVTSTSEKTIIRISELNRQGSVVTSSQVERKATVINSAEVSSAISARDTDLQSFRSQIDEKAALDVDTSSAEAKYSEAKQKIDAARSAPSNQYTQAMQYLTDAQTVITDGEKALDMAWAEKDVADAQVPINNVDALITYFKVNKSMGNDARVTQIITKREIAVSYISSANDAITNGLYTQARSKASDAFIKGNESYNDALTLKKEVDSGFSLSLPSLPGVGLFVVVIVVIILVVVGVMVYRKRSRWDELG